jgi:hypothetical protein
MNSTIALPQNLPATITLESVQQLKIGLATRAQLLRQIIAEFEGRYQCSLSELNAQIVARQKAEHPAWEDSIEWGNAVDQLGQVQLTQSIVAWLINLLTRSAS